MFKLAIITKNGITYSKLVTYSNRNNYVESLAAKTINVNNLDCFLNQKRETMLLTYSKILEDNFTFTT